MFPPYSRFQTISPPRSGSMTSKTRPPPVLPRIDTSVATICHGNRTPGRVLLPMILPCAGDSDSEGTEDALSSISPEDQRDVEELLTVAMLMRLREGQITPMSTEVPRAGSEYDVFADSVVIDAGAVEAPSSPEIGASIILTASEDKSAHSAAPFPFEMNYTQTYGGSYARYYGSYEYSNQYGGACSSTHRLSSFAGTSHSRESKANMDNLQSPNAESVKVPTALLHVPSDADIAESVSGSVDRQLASQHILPRPFPAAFASNPRLEAHDTRARSSSTASSGSEGGKSYPCPECGHVFKRSHDLRRHLVTHSDQKPFTCGRCQKGFIRRDALERHELAFREGKRVNCSPVMNAPVTPTRALAGMLPTPDRTPIMQEHRGNPPSSPSPYRQLRHTRHSPYGRSFFYPAATYARM